MKFWKFAYRDEATMVACLEGRCLPNPEFSPLGMGNRNEWVAEQLSAGDIVVLATLCGFLATFYAVGVVREVSPEYSGVVVDWAAERHDQEPTPSSGLIHWQTKSAFQISPAPAKRYNLKARANEQLLRG